MSDSGCIYPRRQLCVASASLALLSLGLITLLLGACGDSSGTRGEAIAGSPFEPVASAYVFIFARVDCPISNRYAPEIRRIAEKYAADGVRCALVYPDPAISSETIESHRRQFDYPCPALSDPQHEIVSLAGATVTPEAAVFNRQRQLVYCGRIDDRFVAFGRERSQATTHDLDDAIGRVLAGDTGPCVRTPAIGCYIGDLR